MGVNPRFTKYAAGFGFAWPTIYDTVSTLRLGYENTSYKDKFVPRTDKKGTIDFVFNKSLSPQSSFAISMGGDSNSSNVDLYKYNDVNVGVQYLTGFGF